MTGFQSIDVPPERHADRVIAEMLRELAQKRAQIGPAIAEAVRKSKDGGPRAQQRMAERIRQAGAVHVDLQTGTRGRYQMLIYQLAGWNPEIDKEIDVGAPIPERPWISCIVTRIGDRGRSVKSKPMLFMTHHALSRTAQRFGLRTPQHIINITWNIWAELLDEFEAIGAKKFYTTPPQGRRVRIDDDAVIVLQRHRTREALVIATVLSTLGPIEIDVSVGES